MDCVGSSEANASSKFEPYFGFSFPSQLGSPSLPVRSAQFPSLLRCSRARGALRTSQDCAWHRALAGSLYQALQPNLKAVYWSHAVKTKSYSCAQCLTHRINADDLWWSS